jgi:hypothetical protein
MDNTINSLPDDLNNFLAINTDRKIVLDHTTKREINSLSFYAPTEIKASVFTLDTYDYYLNYNEPGVDPNLQYDIEGIDLVRNCGNYEPKGILVYFHAFQEYGCWDSDHLIISMFRGVGWSEIELRLAEFVNAQWYPGLPEQYLLRPWTDERCTSFLPKSSL